MAAEDVALALMMLSNERAHWEVSHGEFGRFEGFRLSDEERELLVASTRGVERRDEKVPVAFRPDDSIVELMEGPGGPERGFGYWPPSTAGRSGTRRRASKIRACRRASSPGKR
jgi:hypothetical protein